MKSSLVFDAYGYCPKSSVESVDGVGVLRSCAKFDTNEEVGGTNGIEVDDGVNGVGVDEKVGGVDGREVVAGK